MIATCKLISSEELTSFSSQNFEKNKNKAKCIEENKLKEDCENIQRFLEAPLDDGVLKISNYYTNLGQPSPNTPTSKVSLPTITNINSNPIESQAKTFYSTSSQSNKLIHDQLNQHGNNWQQILQQNSLGDSSSCLGQIGQQCQPKPFPRIPSFQASSSRSHNNFSTDQNQQNIFHKQNSFQESSHTINNPIQGQLFGTSSSSQRIPSVQILSSRKTNSEPILHLQQINQQHLQQINQQHSQQHPQQHSINYPNQHQQLFTLSIPTPKNIFPTKQQAIYNFTNDYFGSNRTPNQNSPFNQQIPSRGSTTNLFAMGNNHYGGLPLESPTMTINQRNNLQLEHQIQNPLQNKRPQSISISSSTSNSKSTSTDGGDKNNKEMIEKIVCDLQTTIQTIRHQINQNNELCKHLTELKEKSLHQKTSQEALINQNVNMNRMAEHNTQHNLIGNVEEQHLQHFEDPLLFHNVGEHHNNNLFNNMEELQQSITSNVEEQHLPHQQNIEEIFGTSSEPSMLNFEEAAQQNITRKRNVNRKRKN